MVDVIFNSKQLEELEQVHDASGALEDADDEAPEQGRDAAMEWRLQVIEEAAENVKRAKARPVDEGLTYEINSLLFDRDSRRFARVQASVPGYLRIAYLTGGDREYGVLDVDLYLIDVGAQKKPTELAAQLGITEAEVLVHLDRLEITPLEPDGDEEEEAEDGAVLPGDPTPAANLAAALAAAPARSARPSRNEKAKGDGAHGEDDDGGEVEDDTIPPVEAASIKKGNKSAPVKTKPEKGKAASAAKAAKGEKVMKGGKAAAKPEKAAKNGKLPAGAKASTVKAAAAKAPAKSAKGGKSAQDPLGDPNGFIRQNYRQMSNREMARATGLSEHTIRRKLGEWGLKRGGQPAAKKRR